MKKKIRSGFFFKIVLPAMLAILFFILTVFTFIIPSYERNMMYEKKVMLKELSNSVWSILKHYHGLEQSGSLSSDEARRQAVSQIEVIRYGTDKKDYFWITDMEPTMIMHPYVNELNGQSLQDFADPDGKKLFIEAVHVVKADKEGFINYKWQFMDDSSVIEDKLSFVKAFEPWHWIIGTGVYLTDVKQEIASLTNKLIIILIIASIVVSILIFITFYQSLSIEQKRMLAEEKLRESREKYKSLIESSTEGIILLLQSTISYSNAYIQQLLQYSSQELSGTSVERLFLDGKLPGLLSAKNEEKKETEMIRKDGSIVTVVLTMLRVYFAGKDGVLLTIRDTSENATVKSELAAYKTKLSTISRYSKTGLVSFSMEEKNKILEFSHNLAVLLDYQSGNELINKPVTAIFADKDEFSRWMDDVNSMKLLAEKPVHLRKSNNTLMEAKVTFLLQERENGNSPVTELIIEPVEQKMTDEALASAFSIAGAEARNQAVIASLMKPVVQCQASTSVYEAVSIMAEYHSSCILVMMEKKCIGIVTFQDVVTRFIEKSWSPDMLVAEIMTSPVKQVHEDTTLTEALFRMEKEHVSHLVITDFQGMVIGIAEKTDFTGKYTEPIELLTLAVEDSVTIEDLCRVREKIPDIISPLISEGVSASLLTGIISSMNDAITSRIIELTIGEIGQAPVPFAFITIGSDGRHELTFSSDQDNAIVFADCPESQLPEVQHYFLRLGNKICEALNQTGLPLCKGNFMASNPEWCQPLITWKRYFGEWITNTEPLNIMNISAFFDLRMVYGDKQVFKALEDYIFEGMKGRTAFFYNLAKAVGSFKPPVNLFGNIVTESSGKSDEHIDIKTSLATVFMFSRIVALYHDIRLKTTTSRINALKSREILNSATCDEMLYQLGFLTRLRLQHQLSQVMKKQPADNHIQWKKLTEIEQIVLKKIFSQMGSYQQKLNALFMSSYRD